MAICRYWQQGQCRFGNECRFEHPSGGFGSSGGFAQQQQQQQSFGGGQQDITNTLVQTVRVDLEQWEKGNQWIFSCYSPAKEAACFPGLEDLSPEELRLEAYNAKAANTVDQYQQRVQTLIRDYAQKRQVLSQPTDQIKDVLRRIYNKENVQDFSLTGSVSPQQSGIFGNNSISTSSVFQSSNTSAFGSSPPGQSSSNIFGKPSTVASGTSIFGGGGATSSSSGNASSIFGGANKSIFGTQQSSGFGQSGLSSMLKPATTSSIFGQSAQAVFGQQPSLGQSLFGGGSAPQQNSFGQQSSLFGQCGTPAQQIGFGALTTPFGQGTVQAQQSTFGSAPPSSFGNPMPRDSPFVSSPSTFGTASGIFGGRSVLDGASSYANESAMPASNEQNMAAPSPFAPVNNTIVPAANPFTSSSATTATTFNPFNTPSGGGSLFGQGSSGGLFGQTLKPQIDSSTYTPIEQLTEEEKAYFLADKFTLGNVPERPPCREMCT